MQHDVEKMKGVTMLREFIEFVSLEGESEKVYQFAIGEVPSKGIKKLIKKKKELKNLPSANDYKKISKDEQKQIIDFIFFINNLEMLIWSMNFFGGKRDTENLKEYVDYVVEKDYSKKLLLQALLDCHIENKSVNCFKEAIFHLNKNENIIKIGRNLKYTYGEHIIFLINFDHLSNLDNKFLIVDYYYYSTEKKILKLIDGFGNRDEYLRGLCEEIIKGDKDDLGYKAYDIIGEYVKDRDLLLKVYHSLKDGYYKNNFGNEINISVDEMSVGSTKSKFDIFLKNKSTYGDPLVGIEKLVRKDGKDSELAGKCLSNLLCHASLYINDINVMRSELTKESLEEIARLNFEAWKNSGMSIKDKQKISAFIFLGDEKLQKEVVELIKELADNKAKLANLIAKEYLEEGTVKKVIEIRSILANTKSKVFKRDTGLRVEICMNEHNITEEEIKAEELKNADSLTEETLDYGFNKYRVYVNESLKLELERQDGKVFKSLPKALKDDDEEKVALAKEKFKAIKKEYKNTVETAINNIKDAYKYVTMWNGKDWKEVFVNNPLYNKIGKKLLWNLYRNGENIVRFTLTDEISDFDYNKVEILDDDKVAITHKLELSNEEVEKWQEVLKDNEINLLIPQLDVEVYDIGEGLEFEVEDLPIKDYYFIAKLKKLGWDYGTIGDGGSFYELCIQDFDKRLYAEVKFDGSIFFVGGSYDRDASKISQIIFKNYKDKALEPRVKSEIIREVLSVF